MSRMRRSVAIVGVGETPYLRHGSSREPERKLALRAIVAACEDAGVEPREVDGFVSYAHDNNEPVHLVSSLGTLELKWASLVFGGGGGGSAGALGAAAAAIVSGQAELVVVYRALRGRISAVMGPSHYGPHYEMHGVCVPAQTCALRTQRMLELDRVPRSAMRAVVMADYYHAQRNPRASAYGRPLTERAYEDSRWIVEPYRIFDCSRENDAAAAVLLTTAERAKDLCRPAVYLLASAQGAERGWWDSLHNEAQYASSGFGSVARRIWRQSGLEPGDVDVVQVYENFSGPAVGALIDHGFCTPESASDVLRLENLIAPDGKLPINTSGGLLAEGNVHGMGLALEAVRQLRGESFNPVPQAKVCLLTGGPAAPLVSSALLGTSEVL